MDSDWEYPKMEHGKLTKWNWLPLYPDNIFIGYKTDIGAFTLLQGEEIIEIQDYVKIGGGCAIYSVDTSGKKRNMVIIEEGANIGAGSVIMPGVTVGKGAVVGALSFVNKDIPDGETWGGVPARRIRRKVKQ